MHRVTFLIVSSLFLMLTGCSLFAPPPPPLNLEFEESTRVQPQEELAPPIASGTPMMIEPLVTEKQLTDVELLLTAEQSGAEGFIVRYGTTPESLTNEKKVRLNSLDKTKEGDTEAYILVIEDTDPSKNLYLRVQEYKGNTISEPSELISIPAIGKTTL